MVAFSEDIRGRWLQKVVAKILSFEGSHPSQTHLPLPEWRNAPQAHDEGLCPAENSVLGHFSLQAVFYSAWCLLGLGLCLVSTTPCVGSYSAVSSMNNRNSQGLPFGLS